MERSGSALRSTMDEHIAVNLSAEQLRDEGIVARSGDPGMVDEDIHGSLVRYTTVGKKISAKRADGESFKKQRVRFCSLNLFEENVFRT